jgi:uncharacterized paraquat-inducible protein A
MTDDPTRQLPPDAPRTCPKCGASVPPSADFCPTCGANVRPQRSRAWPLVIASLVALAVGAGIALLVADNNSGSASTVTSRVTHTVTAPGATSVTVTAPTRTVTAPPRTTTVTVPAPTNTAP